jgi:hypothetical protein
MNECRFKSKHTVRCTWLTSMYSLGAHDANNSQQQDYTNQAAVFKLPPMPQTH